jgi:hypothetical protein
MKLDFIFNKGMVAGRMLQVKDANGSDGRPS